MATVKSNQKPVPNGPSNAKTRKELAWQTATTFLAFGVVFGRAYGAAKDHAPELENTKHNDKKTCTSPLGPQAVRRVRETHGHSIAI